MSTPKPKDPSSSACAPSWPALPRIPAWSRCSACAARTSTKCWTSRRCIRAHRWPPCSRVAIWRPVRAPSRPAWPNATILRCCRRWQWMGCGRNWPSGTPSCGCWMRSARRCLRWRAWAIRSQGSGRSWRWPRQVWSASPCAKASRCASAIWRGCTATAARCTRSLQTKAGWMASRSRCRAWPRRAASWPCRCARAEKPWARCWWKAKAISSSATTTRMRSRCWARNWRRRWSRCNGRNWMRQRRQAAHTSMCPSRPARKRPPDGRRTRKRIQARPCTCAISRATARSSSTGNT